MIAFLEVIFDGKSYYQGPWVFQVARLRGQRKREYRISLPAVTCILLRIYVRYVIIEREERKKLIGPVTQDRTY